LLNWIPLAEEVSSSPTHELRRLMNKSLHRSNLFRFVAARSAMAITAILCSMGMGSARAQTITISNLWSISTADGRSYVTSGTTERGIAYNPVTGDVLLVSRAAGLQVAILSADTGAELGFLDTTGISGGTFVLSLIGVADDGAIYGANLSTSTTAPNFTIYRWGSETDTPTVVYGPGDPGHGAMPSTCEVRERTRK